MRLGKRTLLAMLVALLPCWAGAQTDGNPGSLTDKAAALLKEGKSLDEVAKTLLGDACENLDLLKLPPEKLKLCSGQAAAALTDAGAQSAQVVAALIAAGADPTALVAPAGAGPAGGAPANGATLTAPSFGGGGGGTASAR
jgi:hypothetical protein